MKKETKVNKPTFLTISIVTIIIGGFLTFVNLYEFYKIGILEQTDNYPFGGEGPTPYYYKTAKLYAKVNLIWGILFLITFTSAIWTVFKRQEKKLLLVFGITLFLLLTMFAQGKT